MYRMNPTLLRLEAMDAQRFDLSKRGVSLKTILVHVISSFNYFFQKPANLTISTAAPTTLSSETDETDETSTMKESGSSTEDATSSSQTVEATILTYKNETQLTDTNKRDEYTTTRTIIIPLSPTLSIFSRPSTPIPGVISRPGSPLGTMLTNLNCIGNLNCMSTDAFEEQLDSILQRHKNDSASVPQEIKVQDTQEQTVSYRETWGNAQWWYPAACLLSGSLPRLLPGTAQRQHFLAYPV